MKLWALVFLSLATLSQVVFTQSSACAAQAVFDLCLKNEDEYLETCKAQDYTCLCKWHTAKLSCWDNCPFDVNKSTQQNLQTIYCSIAGPSNTTTPSATNTAVPVQTSLNPSTPPVASNTHSSSSSAALSQWMSGSESYYYPFLSAAVAGVAMMVY